MSLKNLNDYTIFMDQVLGKGSFKQVYVGECKKTHKKVAIKIISKSQMKNSRDSRELKKYFFEQIEAMKTLHNPNIVQFIDVMQSQNNFYVIQQLCDGDLNSMIKQNQQLDEETSIKLLIQICNGILAIVRQGYVHRDLKPGNIFVKDGILKIGDFGFSKRLSENQNTMSCVGTPLFWSLQILKGEDYTSKCDIWALGIIFYLMLHGQTPWGNPSRPYILIQNIQKIPLVIKRNDLQPTTIDFIKKCLGVMESDRISWNELFVHPIFKGFFDNKGEEKVFENKMKQILIDLRFYIKSKNLDLKKIFSNLGYVSADQELDFEAYYNFLKNVNPDVAKEDALYVFKETDIDHSNTISVLQIEKLFKKFKIPLNAVDLKQHSGANKTKGIQELDLNCKFIDSLSKIEIKND